MPSCGRGSPASPPPWRPPSKAARGPSPCWPGMTRASRRRSWASWRRAARPSCSTAAIRPSATAGSQPTPAPAPWRRRRSWSPMPVTSSRPAPRSSISTRPPPVPSVRCLRWDRTIWPMCSTPPARQETPRGCSTTTGPRCTAFCCSPSSPRFGRTTGSASSIPASSPRCGGSWARC